MDLVARHFATGRWTRFELDDEWIAAVEELEGAEDFGPDDDWVAPAFWDIQTNGRWGISFSSPELTRDQVVKIVRAQAELGTARLCPTLITAPVDATKQALETIAVACASAPDVAAKVVGIHLEGPFLSELDGYRGAHPRDAILDPDWDLFREFQDAADGRIVLTTIAPERPGSIEFIERAASEGIVVALGHTAADGPTLRAAVDAGARLSTHLGNGIVAQLPRHPNPIWEQAAIDGLSASFIADGHHLDPSTLRILTRAKTPGRTILVSDASPLAGLPPGLYGEWAVDDSGKVVVSGTPYLAGAYPGLEAGLEVLLKSTDFSLAEAIATVTENPARLLGRTEPTLVNGAMANLVVFKHAPNGGSPFRLTRSYIDGRWALPGSSSQQGNPALD